MFSAKFACPICNYSLPELEPRLFSFNNPMGYAPSATAWQHQFFDPKAHRRFPHAFLSSGAIGLGSANQFYLVTRQPPNITPSI